MYASEFKTNEVKKDIEHRKTKNEFFKKNK